MSGFYFMCFMITIQREEMQKGSLEDFRRIRAEQDQEYEESLLTDQKKVHKQTFLKV